MYPSMTHEQACETLAALAQYGSEHKAAAALGMSRATFHSRVQRSYQLVDSDVKMAIMHERSFHSIEVNNGKVLVCSDVHAWPGPMTTAQRAFVWFAKTLQPDAIVINGDLFDGSTLSRFPDNNWNTKPTIKQEVDACLRFTRLVSEAAPDAKKIFVPGNHDERYNRKLVAEVPEFAGIEGFDLFKQFPGWHKCYRLTLNPDSGGMTDIVHNWAGGIHAAYNNVLRGGVNYVTGHTHRNLVRPWNDRSGIRWGIETGTLTGLEHPSSYYTGGRPVDWHPGFVLLTFRDGLLLRPEQIDVHTEESVSFRGEVGVPPEYDD